jgi:hypothetical protein
VLAEHRESNEKDEKRQDDREHATADATPA